ncbi:MAG TPA: DUF262 domain-containing protein [Bacteroidales bacterium]|nr:DUF262 domain-containing protein [Bacteroidales bacterium]HOR82303.1 DUF262 domain-containing protein [Bacteroidales bacterium]HPJ91908.1 DUF262 domain-containing protein [Bacteroidales bacterium]
MGNSAINIRDILAHDSYIIPRYQRNYAWGKAEISQLIKDIVEYFPAENSDTGNSKNKFYYLGSLVCFKREDGGFELIDGQQRHTTLTLINLVLKNCQDLTVNSVPDSNLKFDSRKKVQMYIEKLFNTKQEDFQKQVNELNIIGTGSFKDAIEIIQEELRKIDIDTFAKNFYENVYVFRVEVPEDTDLNHYFEIMNSRGEQLEKHEIVKALLMGKITNSNETLKKQEKFAEIWDACSDMSDYIYFNFEKSKREKLFTDKGDLNAENLEEVSVCIGNDVDNDNKIYEGIKEDNQLISIIEKHNITTDFPKKEDIIKNKYRSIIDFPNFLLQVLKIDNNAVLLDDKKLVEQFNQINPEPKQFIFNLLKYRLLFDKYVIKQDLTDADANKQNWGIRKMNSDFDTTIKTFEEDDELVKLQAMVYYSDSTNTYNNWLQEIMKSFETNIKISSYTIKLFNIAKIKFNKDNLSYPNITIFNLYFIDYLLWKLYAENIKGEETFADDNFDKLNELKRKIFTQKGLFNSFKFRQLSSREHLLSQANARLHDIDENICNGIGNLCLISTSQNSEGNKENPIEKKKRFQNDNSSLKRLVMFESYDDNNKWEKDQIIAHKKEIINLINYYTNE